MQFPGGESRSMTTNYSSLGMHVSLQWDFNCIFHQNLFPLICAGFVTSFFSIECGRDYVMQLPKLDLKGTSMFDFCSLVMLPWDHHSWRNLIVLRDSKDRKRSSSPCSSGETKPLVEVPTKCSCLWELKRGEQKNQLPS